MKYEDQSGKVADLTPAVMVDGRQFCCGDMPPLHTPTCIHSYSEAAAAKRPGAIVRPEKGESLLECATRVSRQVNPDAKGLKHDDGKVPFISLFVEYFPRAIDAIAMVSEYGARKYTANGWQTVPDGIRRYTDADGRHLKLETTEGPYDENDSGLSHAAQHAWNALARLELLIRDGKVEVRRGNEIDKSSGKPKPVLGTARKV